MNAIQTRLVQFALRSAAGKYLRRVGKDQFDNVSVGITRLRFTSSDLELNEDAINAELGQGTNIRIVCGYINKLAGDFPIRTNTTRRVVLHGLNLTIDFIGKSAPDVAAADSASASNPHGHRLHTRLEELSRKQTAKDFVSSMVENEAQVESQHPARSGLRSTSMVEDDAAVEGPSGDIGADDIDACADALSTTFKALLHNTTGKAFDVNLRLRFPPPGHDIIPGEPLPPETVEVLVHIPVIDVHDSTDMANAVNNSFRKIVKFSSMMVQVCDVDATVTREEEKYVTHELDLNNTVLQCDTVDLNAGVSEPNLEDIMDGKSDAANPTIDCPNELDIAYDDTAPDKQRWRKKLSVNHVHAVLTPQQLVRVMRVAEYFSRTPSEGNSKSDGADGAAKDAAEAEAAAQAGEESQFRLIFSDVSLALLHTGASRDTVARVWERFNTLCEDPIKGELSNWPHYAIRLSHFFLRSDTPLQPDGDDDHVLSPLFNRVRGTEHTIAINGATVFERQPAAKSSAVILRLEDCGASHQASFVVTRRASFPMTIERASQCGIDVAGTVAKHAAERQLDARDLQRSPLLRFVQQHVFVTMPKTLHIYADVEILDRILGFSRLIGDIQERAKEHVLRHSPTSPRRARKQPDPTEPGMQHRLSEDTLAAAQAMQASHQTTGTLMTDVDTTALQSAVSQPLQSYQTTSYKSAGSGMFHSARSRSNTPTSDSSGSVGLEDLGGMQHEADGDDSSLATNDSVDLCDVDDRPASATGTTKPHLEPSPSSSAPSKPAAGAGGQGRATEGQPGDDAGGAFSPTPWEIGPELIVVSLAEGLMQEVDLQLKFPVSRAPPADLYGPDTIRLFRSLKERSVSASAFEAADRAKAVRTARRAFVRNSYASLSDLTAAGSMSPTSPEGPPQLPNGSFAADDPFVQDGELWYLPRCLVVTLAGLAVTLPHGDADTIELQANLAAVKLRELDTARDTSSVLLQATADQRSAPPSRGAGQRGVRFAGDTPPRTPVRSDADEGDEAAASETPPSQPPPGRQQPLPSVTVLRRPNLVMPRLHLADTEAALSDQDETADVQSNLSRDATMHVDIKVPLLSTGNLYRDHLLMLTFMSAELTECITGALSKDAESRAAAATNAFEQALYASQAGPSGKKRKKPARQASDNSLTDFFLTAKDSSIGGGVIEIPTTAVSVNIHRVAATVFASRLDPEGRPLGEALWTLLSKTVAASADQTQHFHRYRASLQHFSLFMVSQEPAPQSSAMVLLVKARAFDLKEMMPRLPDSFRPPPAECPTTPPFGSAMKLIESNAAMYSRVHAMTPQQLASRPHVFQTSMRRIYNVRQRTDDMDLNVVMDRFVVSHQPAHEGDHWLFVLMAWVSDAPVMPEKAANSDEDEDSSIGTSSGPSPRNQNHTFAPGDVAAAATPSSPDLAPFLARSRVEIDVRDALLEYLPFGRSERVVLVMPELRVDTGDLVSGSPKTRLSVFIDQPIVVMLHDKFFMSLMQYDQSRGAQSVFGNGAGAGFKADLSVLGFVPIAALTHKYASRSDAAREGASSTAAAQQSVMHLASAAVSQRVFMSTTSFAANDPTASIVAPEKPVTGATSEQKVPPVRVLSGVYEEKPLVIDISGLELELSAAWDSFQIFNTVANHWLGGQDLGYLPNPRQLVAWSSDVFAHVAVPPEVKMPPPRAMDDGEAAPSLPSAASVKPTTYVGGQRLDQEELETSDDPLAPLRNAQGELLPQRSVTDDVFDSFDILPEREEAMIARNVTWVPPGKPSSSGPRTQQEVRAALGFAGSADDLGFTELNVSGDVHPWPHGTLSSLFSAPRHFNRANNRFRRRDMDVPAKPLVMCPPPVMELVLSDCSLVLTLCGGSDFVAEHRSDIADLDENWDVMMSTNFRAYQKIDGSHFIRSARSDDQRIVAELSGMFLQLDTFGPEHNMQQRLLLTAQDVSILDRVTTSPVRQLLRCSVPKARRDRPAMEFRWTSFAYSHSAAVDGKRLEEDVAVRVLPMHLSLARQSIELLHKFVLPPTADEAASPTMTEPDSSSSSAAKAPPKDELFFRRFTVHPLEVKVSWHSEVRDVGALAHGDALELMSVMNVEGSELFIPDIVLHGCPMSELGSQLFIVMSPVLWSTRLVYLFAGLQPARTVTEVAGAMGELVLTPLEYFNNNKSVFNGIARGLSACTRRLAGESLRVGSGVTRLAHQGVSRAASSTVPHAYADPMMRGDQPEGLGDGIARGGNELLRGFAGMRVALRNTVADASVDGPGALVKVPLALLMPVDGTFRAMTEVLLGARNSLQPDRRREEVQEFKSTKFSGKPKDK